ncbi:MAG: ketopantoate reductase family protein [Ruminococcus sp.]|nr:ketopantoate reductase family protein [Ruminococcus sp.]
MKITILGAGAMGSLFGGYLSRYNDVWLVEIDQKKVDKINRDGIKVREPDGEKVFYPTALSDTKELGEMDLVIVFVKAMYSVSALEKNKHLLGEHTYVMTLQNGAGHEQTILKFVDRSRVIIGTTKHNSSIIDVGYINHGGGGSSSIGLLDGNSGTIQDIADNFSRCGFETEVSDNVRKSIWSKLFINVSASIMTGVLQTNLDFLKDSIHAWRLVEQLLKEAVAVAGAGGMEFNEAEVIKDVRTLVENAHDGYTSIYADLHNGVRTEVDTINGTIITEAKRQGVPVPAHEFVVELVHAMEDKAASYEA